jgi:hypothetical protein
VTLLSSSPQSTAQSAFPLPSYLLYVMILHCGTCACLPSKRLHDLDSWHELVHLVCCG